MKRRDFLKVSAVGAAAAMVGMDYIPAGAEANQILSDPTVIKHRVAISTRALAAVGGPTDEEIRALVNHAWSEAQVEAWGRGWKRWDSALVESQSWEHEAKLYDVVLKRRSKLKDFFMRTRNPNPGKCGAQPRLLNEKRRNQRPDNG